MADLRATLRLAVPIALVQVGLMAMGVVDTIMVGHVSPAALAAVALGNVYFTGPTLFGQGVLMALDPIVSQAAGARDHDAIARALQRGVLAALLLTAVTAAAFVPVAPVLAALRQPRDVVPTSAAYVLVCIPGVLPFFGFVVLRQTLQAVHRTAAIVLAIVAANLVNAGLNWLLIFGNLGFPRWVRRAAPHPRRSAARLSRGRPTSAGIDRLLRAFGIMVPACIGNAHNELAFAGSRFGSCFCRRARHGSQHGEEAGYAPAHDQAGRRWAPHHDGGGGGALQGRHGLAEGDVRLDPGQPAGPEQVAAREVLSGSRVHGGPVSADRARGRSRPSAPSAAGCAPGGTGMPGACRPPTCNPDRRRAA
jgi:MATE family multidrug resistance protein